MTPIVQSATDILSFFTVLADILAIFLFVIATTSLRDRGWGKRVGAFFGKYAVLFSFLIAIGGVIGSLFYSEFAHFRPCVLCWIERGFLYTDAVIFIVAMLARKEEHVRTYGNFVRNCAITLSSLGFVVSAYHSYLQLGGNSLIPCSATGVSCEFVYFMEYGYVTIPMMALTAFALVLLFMVFHKRNSGI
jgi:disulfide bond formation protein DsbB